MATVGRNLAVADLNGLHLKGMLAWLAWMFVHLISLLGMRNKLTVLINPDLGLLHLLDIAAHAPPLHQISAAPPMGRALIVLLQATTTI